MMVCVVADNKEKNLEQRERNGGSVTTRKVMMMVTSTSGSPAYLRIPDKETPF